MKIILSYGEVKKSAIKTRAELFQKDEFDPTRGKIRRKPRKKEDLGMLYERALERTRKYRPCIDQDGKLILPYFYPQPGKQEG